MSAALRAYVRNAIVPGAYAAGEVLGDRSAGWGEGDASSCVIVHTSAANIAISPYDGPAIFRQNPSVDVMLTDVVMPGESGPSCARALQADHPNLHVVYMSGYAEDTIAHHGVLDPGIVFLHKPFTVETLGLKISEGLDAVH